MTIGNHFEVIAEEGIHSILGIREPVPISPRALARGLRVTFFPVAFASDRVLGFGRMLRQALIECGVTVVEYEAALHRDSRKLMEGIVVIASGQLETGNLPVDHVSNLRTTTAVSILDGPAPVSDENGSQKQLNSIVGTLAWNITQMVIFVEDAAWTVCTMNGAIIRCRNNSSFAHDVFSTLIPKLAAPVVPPHASDFEFREGALNLAADEYAPYVQDFVESGDLWARTGLMLFHTTLDSLNFRSKYYKRIAAAYLDHRSGMSYGFLARQLPAPITPGLTLSEAHRRFGGNNGIPSCLQAADGRIYVALNTNGEAIVTEVPDVKVLTTRSGCDKSHVDAGRDIILMGLSSGRIFFETPEGISARVDCKPSYDTLTILSHAVGNALIASVLARANPRAPFTSIFQKSGMALAHWHGQINRSILPDGYFVHGDTNPPVSCSTHQAAIYALTGKVAAMKQSLERGVEFIGDVHVEPHHGTNITGTSLLTLAEWVLENIDSIRRGQSDVMKLLEEEIQER